MNHNKTIPSLIEEERRFEWVDEGDLAKTYTLSGRSIYLIGLENGEYHGRWNGIWSLPIKVADSVRFGIAYDSEKIEWLSNYCRRYISRLSHVERIYDLDHLGAEVSQLEFIPEEGMSVCWRFRATNNSSKEKTYMLIANPTVNLMWEAKQMGKLWKEREELFFYDEKAKSIIIRHHSRPSWVAIFGANVPATTRVLGIDEVADVIPEPTSPSPIKPCYGNAILAYPLKLKPGQSSDIIFALTGGSDSLYSLLSKHEFALSNFTPLLQAKNTIYTEFIGQTVNIECPYEPINRAFDWSKVNLHMLRHFQPGFGLGFMAGLPHFPIYFGRDIAWTSLGASACGDFQAVRESLLLLARFQASEDGEDPLHEPFYEGEIPHEIRTERTIYYYSIDATPLFVIAVYNYHRWSWDDAFLTFVYKNVVSAVEWCIKADRDGDGLIEHGPEGFLPDTTWMDSYYRGKSAVDVQAIFCHALFCGARIASYLGDKERASKWERRLEKLKRALLQRYWNKESRFFSDTILPDGTPVRDQTVNSVVPVLFKLTPPDISRSVLVRLDSGDFMTDWGVRTRAKSDPKYDPRNYQKGGVWPFCTGLVTYGDFIWDRYEEGLKNTLRLAKSLELGSNYFKEILYGDMPPTGAPPVHPTGCFIQAWSAGIFMQAVIMGLFRVEPKGPGQLSFKPYIPEGWSRMEIKSIRLGDNMIDTLVRRDGKEIVVKVANRGSKSLRLETGFVVPLLAPSGTAKEAGKRLDIRCRPTDNKYTEITSTIELKAHQAKNVIFSLGSY